MVVVARNVRTTLFTENKPYAVLSVDGDSFIVVSDCGLQSVCWFIDDPECDWEVIK